MKLTNFLYLILISGLMVLSLPAIILLGLLVFVFSGWPIFFTQLRTGKSGKSFWIIKFRTMKVGAESDKESLLVMNEADGPAFKIYNDPRLTAIGKFLYHTGLDEMPQIFNVLKGEMSLVGPRPLPVSEADQIDSKTKKIRESVKPGIISPWIFIGYHNLSFADWMKSDCIYVKKKSLLYDFGLMIKAVVVFGNLIYKEIFRQKN